MAAPAIVTTIGGASSNSYLAIADMTVYFSGRPNVSAWTDASADEKAEAAITAARRLNDEQWAGSIVNTDPRQALAWPRYGAVDREGVYIDGDEIPQVVKDAQCEIALALLNAGTEDTLADSGLEAFNSVTVGPISVEPNHGQVSDALPNHVRRMLTGLLLSTGYSARLVLG